MKLLIVFGSTSDESHYLPLYQGLKKRHLVDMKVISAHRNPSYLAHVLTDHDYDAIIAGAGLAAHLPGVVASKVKVPVFGVPVAGQFGGLDAFASIVQMPFGVPVLSTGPDRAFDLVKSLDEVDALPGDYFHEAHLIVKEQGPYVEKEIERAEALAESLGMRLTRSDRQKAGVLNINYVSRNNPQPLTEGVHINVPLLDDEAKHDPSWLVTFFNWAREGGLWCGANNTRNALLFAEKLKGYLTKRFSDMNMDLVNQGSVKDIYRNADGMHFVYSDRYSIFDWGEMPDAIEKKGDAQAYFADMVFKLLGDPDQWKRFDKNWLKDSSSERVYAELSEFGVRHHSKGLSRVYDKLSLKVMPYTVIKPKFSYGEYDYSAFERPVMNTVVPLEVIFRFGVPRGSSILKRAKDDAYCEAIGVKEPIIEGERFKQPLIEFSTKFESTDRYIAPNEAARISGMTESEMSRLATLARLIAYKLRQVFEDVELELWDGKFEFAFGSYAVDGREFVLIDSVGPDELRLIYKGKQLSKQTLREFYRDSDWHHAVDEAKRLAQERKLENWQQICREELKQNPASLKDNEKQFASKLFKTLTNALAQNYFDERCFDESSTLEDLL